MPGLGRFQVPEDDWRWRVLRAGAALLALAMPLLLWWGPLAIELIAATTMAGMLFSAYLLARSARRREREARAAGARLAAEVAERARVERLLREDAERFAAIIALQHDVVRAELDADRVLALVAARAQELTAGAGATVQLVDGDEIVYRAATGVAAPLAGTRRRLGDSFSAASLRANAALRCDDTALDPRVPPGERERERAGIRSMVVFPLQHDRATVGVLEVLSTAPNAFTSRDIDTLKILAGIVGASLDLAAAISDREQVSSERASALAALSKSEERFRSAFDSAAIGMAIVGLDGTWLKVNPSLCAMLGYEEFDLVGTSFQAITHPDDLDSDLALVRQLADGTISHYQLEKRYLHFDGRLVWALLSASAVRDERGRAQYFIAQLQDVSERKRAEGRLARQTGYVELLQVAAIAANEAASVEDALQTTVDAICRRLGWPVGHAYRCVGGGGERAVVPLDVWHAAEDGGTPWPSLAGALYPAPGRTLVEDVLATGRPVWVEDITNGRAGAARGGIRAGFAFPVRVGSETAAILEFYAPQSMPRDDEALEVMEQIGTQLGRAVERARAADELLAFAGALERSNRELQEFAYVASHDLKAPLLSLHGIAHLLLEEYHDQLDAEGRLYLDRIAANADRMRLLLEDVLQLSRMQRDEADTAPVDLAAVVEAVLGGLRHLLDARGARVVLAGALPVVLARRAQLEQLFSNLIDNAVTYTPAERAPRVTVACHDRNDHWEIIVRDNGAGIPPAYRESALGMFQRLPAGKAMNPNGTGMGLAIVARIAENHGGACWIADAGEGTDATSDTGASIHVTLSKTGARRRGVAPASAEPAATAA